jgi:thiol-disulfide isomerase/thioredoxin/outer membrane lipoprotein-sorting protein
MTSRRAREPHRVGAHFQGSRAVIVFAFTASVCAAQQLPDGQTLYDRAQAAAKNFHSLQYEVETTLETGLPAAPIKMTTESAYLNPGKTRNEIKTSGITMLDVSDGETTWVYSSAAKQYTKIHAAQAPAAFAAAMGLKLPDLSSIRPSYRTTGEQTIEIDGQKHECWMVEMQIGEIPLPFPQAGPAGQNVKAPKMTGAVMTSWIDKKLGIELQTTLALKMEINGTEMQMHQTMLKKNIKIDQPVDEALFTFTPPPGVKEVHELNLFGAVAPHPDLAGKPAPAFEVKSIGGESYSLSALKGKPVLLDFWATWCAPCRKSMPALEKISADSKNTGLVILGVNIGEDQKIVEEFLKKTPFGYPAVMSGESGILESYQVTAYPTFILIGRDGKIAGSQIGFGGEDQLRQLIGKAELVPKKE